MFYWSLGDQKWYVLMHLYVLLQGIDKIGKLFLCNTFGQLNLQINGIICCNIFF